MAAWIAGTDPSRHLEGQATYQEIIRKNCSYLLQAVRLPPPHQDWAVSHVSQRGSNPNHEYFWIKSALISCLDTSMKNSKAFYQGCWDANLALPHPRQLILHQMAGLSMKFIVWEDGLAFLSPMDFLEGEHKPTLLQIYDTPPHISRLCFSSFKYPQFTNSPWHAHLQWHR